ncbi:histidine phosphotransferase family protein [Novispirillum itersonii]|uniref:histidine phosphotransferase family protein n=1 Tax=Novispirillum itersonii TaxID=189 RepID=UPI00037E08BB|nr:histidine phosphotransferase family protein [Novispirillum itersonii]
MSLETVLGTAAAFPADQVRLSSAVSTRLCHDLAGPVGALNAGIELLADETDPAFITETAALLRHSAEAAAIRLKYMRLAFGVVAGSALRADELRRMVQGFVAASGTPVSLQWRIDAARLLSDRQVQGVLLGALAAFDLLRTGGELVVAEDGADGFVFGARSGAVTLTDEVRAVLTGDLTALSPRTAPLAVLGVLVGGGIRCETGSGAAHLVTVITAYED